MRKSGYYWVKYEGEWIIAEYIRSQKEWTLTGGEERLSDVDFQEIDEQIIVRQPEK